MPPNRIQMMLPSRLMVSPIARIWAPFLDVVLNVVLDDVLGFNAIWLAAFSHLRFAEFGIRRTSPAAADQV